MTTEVFNNEFKGNPMFSVYEVDEKGEKVARFNSKSGQPMESKPVVNIGLKKAEIIFHHLEELKAFVRGAHL